MRSRLTERHGTAASTCRCHNCVLRPNYLIGTKKKHVAVLSIIRAIDLAVDNERPLEKIMEAIGWIVQNWFRDFDLQKIPRSKTPQKATRWPQLRRVQQNPVIRCRFLANVLQNATENDFTSVITRSLVAKTKTSKFVGAQGFFLIVQLFPW